MPHNSRHSLQWDQLPVGLRDEVGALRFPLLAWLEAVVGKNAEGTGMPTGATIQGTVRNADDTITRDASKYKLLPLADYEHSIFSGHGTGVVFGLDRHECERVFGDPRGRFPQLTWLGPEVFYTANPDRRDYWWVVLSAGQNWEHRRLLLQHLRDVIQKLEKDVEGI
jgi:hypothetical protein